MTVLTFNSGYGVSCNYQILNSPKDLGECFEFLQIVPGKIIEESWELSSIVNDLSIANTIKSYSGVDPFEWRLRAPVPTNFGLNLVIDELGEYVATTWKIREIAPNLWEFSTNFSKWNHWYIDECQVTEVDLADDFLDFPFDISYNSTRNFNIKFLANRFNGGIETRVQYSYNSSVDSWSINKVVSEAEKDITIKFLSDLAGSPFRFRNLIYTCKSWGSSYLAPDIWQLNLTFMRSYQPFKQSPIKDAADKYDLLLTKEEVLAKFQESVNNTVLDELLNGAITWFLNWQKADYPYILNDVYILRNSFHKVLGRGGYFPSSGAPTEAQAVIVRACAYVYTITGDIRYKTLAINCANALLNYFFPLQIPSTWTEADGIRVPHWLVTTESFVTKGKVADDPLNYGFFDLILNFTNGVASIPFGDPYYGELLSDVYRVYPITDRLLWQNVYAEPLGGFWWDIEYWTSNILLEGVIVKYYPESSQPGGKAPTPTTDPPGIIKLDVAYTGQAQVVYAAYVGGTVPINTGFEAYPMWRLLQIIEALGAIDVFPWAADGLQLMQLIDPSNPMWTVAFNCVKYTEAIAAQVINLTYWYKKEDALNPFAYPGSQIVVVPEGDRIVTSSREIIPGGTFNFLRVDIPASLAPYPSIEFSNYAVTATVDENTLIYVEATASVNTELEIIISLNPDPFNFDQYYKRYLPVTAFIVSVATINPQEFVFWDMTQTIWHPRIAENPIYTYSDGDGFVSVTKDYPIIEGVVCEVSRIDLFRFNDYAGAGLVTRGIAPDLTGKQPFLPLRIFYKIEGIAILKITIGGLEYLHIVENQDWTESTFNPQDFKDTFEGDFTHPSGTLITNIEFVATPNITTVWVFWLGKEPQRLLGTQKTYKAVVASRVTSAHTLWVGDFRPIGSPSDILPYNPGVVPFTVNVFDDGSGQRQIIEGWRGAPASGYQYPAWYVRHGYWDRLRQVLQFLEDAQNAYQEQNVNGTFGVFAPTYIWGYWDNLELENGEYGFFSFKGVDPNTQWEGYQIRPAESVAHAWYRMVYGEYPNNIPLPADFNDLKKQAQRITMGFCNWLSGFYLRNVSIKQPTDFPPIVDPSANYFTIHFPAIALRMFIYANLADSTRRNAAVTLRGIKACLDFLNCEFQENPLNPMYGSFSKSQPSFVYEGQNLKEMFGFWQAETVEALALLKAKQNDLRIPECCIFLKNICPL